MEGTHPADENLRAVAEVEQSARERLSFVARISNHITAWAGSGASVAIHALLFGGWIGVNVTLGKGRAFDPFPFTLLTSVVSLEAIFLTLFVLASQNRLRRESDKRTRLDLQVNLLAEQEMTLVLHMLKELCLHVGVTDTVNSPAFKGLIKQTDVADLAKRVEQHFPEKPDQG